MLKRVLCFLGIFGIWSDSASGNGRVANSLPQNPLNYRAERSVADEDRTHRFVASYVYELPVGQLANLTDTGNPSNTGGPDRPNVIHDWHLAGGQSLQRWFDITAFALNAPFTFGNAGRNLLRGPRQTNLDFAIYKAFRITERFRLQFRAEAFNATNTPAFGAPNAQVGAPAFGVISSAGTPRNLQAGLKAIFRHRAISPPIQVPLSIRASYARKSVDERLGDAALITDAPKIATPLHGAWKAECICDGAIPFASLA